MKNIVFISPNEETEQKFKNDIPKFVKKGLTSEKMSNSLLGSVEERTDIIDFLKSVKPSRILLIPARGFEIKRITSTIFSITSDKDNSVSINYPLIAL